MNTILVTGGLGFIGSHLIDFLLSSNNSPELRVMNIDYKGLGSQMNNIANNVTNDFRYHFVEADINNIESLDLVSDIDTVINVAAETHVDRSIMDPSKFIRSNYNGTFALLEYSRKKNINRYIQISTDEVYGEALDLTYSFNEFDSLNPSNPYSSTKAAADLLVCSYFRTYGLNACITRCTNNFGPRQFTEKLIPRTVIRILIDLPILIYGDGKHVRDWLYVEDHIKAIDKITTGGRAGQIYNISASNYLTNIDLVRRISSIVEQKTGRTAKILFTDDRPGHDYRYSLNSAKISQDLGWKPEAHFENALERTVLWYINNKKWWYNLIDPFVTDRHPWRQNK